MYVAVNKKNEIKQVGVSTDPSLTSLYIKDEENPFEGWSDAKICCYKVLIKDGYVMMMTPYVDSRLLDHFDQIGTSTQVNAADIADNREGLIETFDEMMVNSDDIADCREAIIELFDMITGGDE